MLLDCSSSCTDLIFTSQHNLVTNSGVNSSLYSNCHYQIIFSEFNGKVNYPPPYQRVVSEFDKVNKDLTAKATKAFHWNKKLSESVKWTKLEECD